LAGAQNDDKKAVANKLAASVAFTAALDTTAEMIGYQGTAVIASARAFLASVGSDAASLTAATAQTALDSTVSSVVAAGSASSAAGSTFTLTTGADNFSGTSGNDSYVGSINSGTTTTFGVGDAIVGGRGVDTLTLNDGQSTAGTVTLTMPAGASISSIEKLVLNGGAGLIADTSGGAYSSLTDITVNNTGIKTLTLAAGQSLIATTTAAGTNDAAVDGGNNVNVTYTGGSTGIITVGATTAASGNVVVSNTTGTTGGVTMGAIAVTGGKTVSVTTAGGNAVNTTDTMAAVTVAGNLNTTSIKVSQPKAATAAAVNGSVAGVVGILNGDVTITDVNNGSATDAGVLTSVELNSFGAATVDSGALTSLTLTGKGTSAAVTMGALTTPVVTALALNVAGLTTTGAVTTPTVTTLNINSTGTASTVNSLVAAAATTINVTGDAKFTATGNTTGAVTAINVTNTAGGAFGTAIGTGVTFTGGAGADAVVLTTGYTKAITMGAGNDTVTYAGPKGTGGSISGGDGIDTVKMTTAIALTAAGSSAFNTAVTGFEKLELSSVNTDADVLDLDGINGVDIVKLGNAVTGTFTLNNIGSGGTVTVTTNGAATPVLVLGVQGALSGAADVINIELSKSSGVLAAGEFTAANIETVNITTKDAATAGSAAVIHTATLVATSATSVTVAGNNGLTLTNAGNTAITKFDASGVVANDTVATPGVAATTDTAANLAVTFASANTTATAVVTITGGAGNDTLTGNAGKDTIVGGAGADSITGGTGIDTLTGGAGRDTFVFAAGDAGVTGTEKVTDYTIGTSADTLNLDTTTLVADVTASDITSVIAGSTALTATVKSGIITLGGADAAMVDTLGKWKLVFEALEDATAADVAAFVYGGNTYVITDDVGTAANDIIQLTGLTTATKLVTVAAAGGILIA